MNDTNENNFRHEIIMCMGSACFTRGNNRSVEIVKTYLKQNSLEADVSFRGCLCNNRCKAAPVITINGRVFEKVVPQSIVELLEHVFKDTGDCHEPA
ncbi:MAG: (2Fe-2S) ferredoxin domain-containing protein [Erysipelotrichia bacterium]|nr:(2Fe-2S) ferredoxin domain-containing protein [Erysipelotrichia bacterium]